MNTEIIELSKNEFPPLLHEISDPPKKLFIRGEIPPQDSLYITVVGSRKNTPYGKSVTESLIKGLAGYNIVIVSGLALGTDAAAHIAALSAGIQTVAVPGSGLSDKVLYPRTNFNLARQILESGGALLSEFEPDFQATQWSFPQRNRIMAGMSHVVLIIEAEEKSGTLITARLGLDYNREVCAVPGPITSSTSVGTNSLIRYGAVPVTSSADILEILGIDSSQKSSENNFDPNTPEGKVLEILSSPKLRNELIQELGMEIKDTQILLSKMEIDGFIQEKGDIFLRVV